MKVKELSEVRIERGYSIEDAASRMGIGSLALREYETDPSIVPVSIACLLANFYRVSIDNVNFK
ncbi:helix-turn-helix domain-containing protein [Paenibacillus wenxiniae]|uniref:Helix-turn-helix domain-containing protein n=1 Tax=Paenibacillus wenxiniae TaxID=1636843 RepID=A0ABW4RHN6_9BACL